MEYINGAGVDDAGNTLATAISLSGSSGSGILGSAGGTDTDDYYKLIPAASGTLALALTGLSADIDLRLLNGLGTELSKSALAGTANEGISYAVTAGQTYYVRVDPSSSSNYQLTVTPPAVALDPSDAGNSIDTASRRGGASETIGGSVGGLDTDDYYQFTANASGTASLSLTGLSADLDLRLLNSAGTQLSSSTHAGTSDESISYAVTAGQSYYVRVDPYGDASSSYDLKLVLPESDTSASGVTISIGSTTAGTVLSEGNSGATAYTFTIRRGFPNGAESTVKYAVTGTAQGIYSAASGSDFTGGVLPSGTISFAGNEISKQLTIYVAGDTMVENGERFDVTLSSPTNARLVGTSAYGIINNDDAAAASIGISSTSANTIKNEGNSGGNAYSFTVSRTDSSGAATVKYAVTGATDSTRAAASASDFSGGVLPSGTISFASGETSKLLTINVAGDTTSESNERFNVTLSSPTNATLGVSGDYGIINNDDGALINISSTSANTIKNEGNSGGSAYSFTVSRSSSDGAATVKYAVAGAADGTRTAASASDFAGGVLPSGTISFASGETSKLLTINVAGDTTVEGNERFNVTLSSPTNATLGLASSYGIINNDDPGTSPGATETIKSDTSRTLSDGEKDLTLTGSGNISGTGNALDNTITGNSGSNYLSGKDGVDILIGGIGGDYLTGGGGNDIFVIDSLADSNPGAYDRIQDFAGGDRIDLRGIDANTTLAGDQAFTLINGAFSGVAGQLAVFGNTVVGDVDGDRAADLYLIVYTNVTGHTWTAADFFL